MDVLPDHRIPRQLQTGSQILELGKVSQCFEVVAMVRLSRRDRRGLDELPPFGAGHELQEAEFPAAIDVLADFDGDLALLIGGERVRQSWAVVKP